MNEMRQFEKKNVKTTLDLNVKKREKLMLIKNKKKRVC